MKPPPFAIRLILASSSPRRAALLRAAGYGFDVVSPVLEEPADLVPETTPVQRAQALSYFKAAAVAKGRTAGIVLGADTIVALNDRAFGKPADAADARRILGELTGTTHQVITGLTLLDCANGRRIITHDVTIVTMRTLEPDELDAYILSEAWVGKAGAYGVQDRADAFITHLEGSYSNVVGLPMELLGNTISVLHATAQAPAAQGGLRDGR